MMSAGGSAAGVSRSGLGAGVGSGVETVDALSTDQAYGLFLAVSSSLCIGASFIIKKKGLKRAGSSGVRASSGGYGYLQEPLWWMGMTTMIVGEVSGPTHSRHELPNRNTDLCFVCVFGFFARPSREKAER